MNREERTRGRGRVKAADVARHAQVSVATVSLVANGKHEGRVSPATADRVREAIRELGYVVDPAARSLVTGRHRRVALVAQDVTNPFVAAVAAGVAEVLGSDMQLILVAGPHDTAADLATITSFGLDGMLVNLAGAEEDPRLGAADLPVVVLDESAGPCGLSHVFFDVGTGARALSDHLAGLGHRAVVYLDSARDRTTFADRRAHFCDAFGAHERVRILHARSAITLDAALDTVGRAVDDWQGQGATAVVAATDVQAYGALAALDRAGVAVPDAMSVASFDNNSLAAVTLPPLTAVDLPARELGTEAAQMLVNQILGLARPGRSVSLPSALVVRRSTGPARTIP